MVNPAVTPCDPLNLTPFFRSVELTESVDAATQHGMLRLTALGYQLLANTVRNYLYSVLRTQSVLPLISFKPRHLERCANPIDITSIKS